MIEAYYNFVVNKYGKEAADRLQICKTSGPNGSVCPMWWGGGVCSACGCLMHVKARDPKEHCKLNKW